MKELVMKILSMAVTDGSYGSVNYLFHFLDKHVLVGTELYLITLLMHFYIDPGVVAEGLLVSFEK